MVNELTNGMDSEKMKMDKNEIIKKQAQRIKGLSRKKEKG